MYSLFATGTNPVVTGQAINITFSLQFSQFVQLLFIGEEILQCITIFPRLVSLLLCPKTTLSLLLFLRTQIEKKIPRVGSLEHHIPRPTLLRVVSKQQKALKTDNWQQSEKIQQPLFLFTHNIHNIHHIRQWTLTQDHLGGKRKKDEAQWAMVEGREGRCAPASLQNDRNTLTSKMSCFFSVHSSTHHLQDGEIDV